MDIVFRGIVLYGFVIFLMRVIGRRELSQLTAVDLVLLIVLGDAIQQGLTQDDYSVTGALIAITTIACVQVVTSYVSFRSKRLRRIFEGSPIVVLQDGKLVEANLRRERLSPDDIAEEMRSHEIAHFDEVAWGILEANGKINFIKKK
jgi:uncharacterized membrane protein YcaP (DUF421 family)